MKQTEVKVERAVRFPGLKKFANEDSLKSTAKTTCTVVEESDAVGDIISTLGDDGETQTANLVQAVNAFHLARAEKSIQAKPAEAVVNARDTVAGFVAMGLSEEAALVNVLSIRKVREALAADGVVFNEDAPAIKD